jgi:O-antigen ligase
MPASDLLKTWTRDEDSAWVWPAFASFTGIFILLGVWKEEPMLMLVPGALLFAAWFVRDIRPAFYLLLFTLPLSFEFNLSDSLGTDLPSEPLMLLLTGALILRALYRPEEIRLNHWFDLLLLTHWCWLAATVLFAEIPLIALKFLLAKTWYILTFYTLTRILLTRPERWQRAIWLVLVPLALTHLIALLRFRAYDFAFADVNKVVVPFYRNHVTFAALAVVVLPYGWYLFRQLRGRFLLRALVLTMLLIILAGVQFSYTRAAYVALIGGVAATFLIRWRLLIPSIGVAAVVAVTFLASMVKDNHYLNFAPDYNKTITHYEFSDLVNATYKLQDISTMERVYRWIAGFYMIGERPWTGFGPNNFYHHYQAYTARAFRTYVSDNPERSGIHSYYLMTAVEQGLPGLAIYLLLILAVLVMGERIYHRTREPRRKGLVLTALASLVIIHLLQTMNDLVETDKVGPFFFMAMALLVGVDQYNRREAGADQGAAETRTSSD